MKKQFLIFLLLALIYANSFAQWQKANAPVLSRGWVSDLVFTGNCIFAGTTYGVLYLSKDNGNTWEKLKSEGYNIIYHKGKVYAGTGKGVISSSDSGKTWTTLTNCYAVNPSITSINFVDDKIFTTTLSGVFLSTDEGKYWSPKNIGFDFDNAVRNEINTLLINKKDLFTVYKNSIYMSRDYGDKWIKLYTIKNNTINDVTAKAIIVIGKIIIMSVYVYNGPSGILLSHDYGKTWSFLEPNLKIYGVNTLIKYKKYCFAGNHSDVYISKDSCKKWVALNSGLKDKNVVSLAINKDTIYACTVGAGVWKRSIPEIIKDVYKKKKVKKG